MENKLIIERLQLTIDNLRKLKPEQFNYAETVTEFDKEKGCGTICCAMGFYPVWYPNFFNYQISSFAEKMYTVDDREILCYHGITTDEYDALFYGMRLKYPELPFTTLNGTPLREVIERFETLKAYYESKL